MSFLIDEVARIVASPMPRRKCLKLLGGVLSGAVLAALSGGRAKAQTACSNGCQTTVDGQLQNIRCNANTPCEACTNCCCNNTTVGGGVGAFGICVPGTPCGGHGCCTDPAKPKCCTGSGNTGNCCAASDTCGAAGRCVPAT